MWNRFTWGWNRFVGLEAIECSKSSPSESILLSMELVHFGTESLNDFLNRFALEVYEGSGGLELDLRQQRTIGSSKCLWGLCFHVGQRLTLRLTVAAGGPPANVPATNLGPADWSSGKFKRWSSSASSGSVGIGYDNRPGELILACRI
ncbi:hypothetical protein PIB30_053255 [Stylosanthes scabra]|uniref:Uncharacterized protein n=1 Tax=Stylosanthes scabra TaxID=79078 RepID=A0ABU6ZH88_9FABA|nr:hypothetical protein [Stylosanthes scabra]